MLSWIKRQMGYSTTPSAPPKGAKGEPRLAPKSSYDAAKTHKDNTRHWSNADGLSANAGNSAEVRRILRNRSRYEDGNNSYVNGLTGDRANETIGTGPRLQLTLPERFDDPDFQVGVDVRPDLARAVEHRFKGWCEAIGLLDKLLVMDESDTREGEVFAFRFVNPKSRDAVQLDVRLYEADQVDTPDFDYSAANAVPGIVFDEFGNPEWYHVLKSHPGDATAGYFGGFGGQPYEKIPARQMIHWFRPRRAGQARGIPAFTSSLPLNAILRRVTLASALTAEAQSRINAVIEQEHALPDYSGTGAGTQPDDGGEEIQFAGTHAMVLSAGQTAKALAATAPGPAYSSFKGEILTEAGRPINAPGNISRGTSADMNYSSGRLDMQQWQRAIRIRRRRLERIVLDWLFRAWVAEAVLIPGYLPAGLPPLTEWRWNWRWDAFTSIDPVKDATAATERLANGTSTLDRECGDLGEDWEEVQDQRLIEEAREIRRRKEMKLGPKAGAAKPTTKPAPVPADGKDEDAAEDAADE